jgi:hypothetical protein
MGLFDRWRSAGDRPSAEGQGLDALAADMTKQGVIIITRNGGALYGLLDQRPDERPAPPDERPQALGGGRRARPSWKRCSTAGRRR